MAKQPPDETSLSKSRVTLTDGTSVELKDAYVKGDTLYGTAWHGARAIPLENIVKIEERSIHGWKTALVVLGVLIVVGGIVGVAYLASYSYY